MATKYACFFPMKFYTLVVALIVIYLYNPMYPYIILDDYPRLFQKCIENLPFASRENRRLLANQGGRCPRPKCKSHCPRPRRKMGYMAPPSNTGWWFQFQPLWKVLISQLELLFPIYGKIKNVPNNQPVSGRNHLANWGFYMGCLFVVSTSTAG